MFIKANHYSQKQQPGVTARGLAPPVQDCSQLQPPGWSISTLNMRRDDLERDCTGCREASVSLVQAWNSIDCEGRILHEPCR